MKFLLRYCSEFTQRQIARWLSIFVLPEDSLFELSTNADSLCPWLKCERQPAPGSADYIVLNGILHYERDIQTSLGELKTQMRPSARLILVYYSSLWRPLVRLADKLGLRRHEPEENWLDHEDVRNLVELAGFEIVRRDPRVLVPLPIPLVAWFANRWLAPLPGLSWLCLTTVAVVRIRGAGAHGEVSASVVVPARNEAGNIENIVRSFKTMGPQDELIFVEGNSTDNTWEEIQRVAREFEGRTPFQIRITQQERTGKGDAVRKGFAMARNDVLMILDADMTVSPEDLAKFFHVLAAGDAEFVNGSRLVYPQEKKAMRFLNMLGNKAFAIAFTLVLGQRFKDTLCGTKVLWRRDYERLAARRWFFGDFDPFGDFDLIFGASRLALKLMEVPIRYKERVYGDTNIHRWAHGLILLRMTFFAARRIKFV